MMSLSEERYLSTSSLSPSYTHFIASLKNVWYDNYLLWVLLSIFARQFHHNSIPKSPLCAYSFQEGQNYSKAPSENFYQGGHGVIFFKNDEKWKWKEEKVPMILSQGVQIKWPKIFPIVSPFPPSPLNIWNSIRSEFDQVPTSRESLFLHKTPHLYEDHTPWAIETTFGEL